MRLALPTSYPPARLPGARPPAWPPARAHPMAVHGHRITMPRSRPPATPVPVFMATENVFTAVPSLLPPPPPNGPCRPYRPCRTATPCVKVTAHPRPATKSRAWCGRSHRPPASRLPRPPRPRPRRKLAISKHNRCHMHSHAPPPTTARPSLSCPTPLTAHTHRDAAHAARLQYRVPSDCRTARPRPARLASSPPPPSPLTSDIEAQ